MKSTDEWWRRRCCGRGQKEFRRKLESIKAVALRSAMVASEFFAITRFLENFDEPFHNSCSHTRSFELRLRCWWCSRGDVINGQKKSRRGKKSATECSSIKISGWQINLTIERSPWTLRESIQVSASPCASLSVAPSGCPKYDKWLLGREIKGQRRAMEGAAAVVGNLRWQQRELLQ